MCTGVLPYLSFLASENMHRFHYWPRNGSQACMVIQQSVRDSALASFLNMFVEAMNMIPSFFLGKGHKVEVDKFNNIYYVRVWKNMKRPR